MIHDRQLFVDYFKERFGVPEDTWTPYELRVGARSVHLVSPPEPPLSWNVDDAGFRVAGKTSDAFKPTTRCIQWLTDRITKSRVTVRSAELRRLLDRETIEPHDNLTNISRGFVAISFQHVAVGCGFWTGDLLRTQISKSQSKEFPRDILSQLED